MTPNRIRHRMYSTRVAALLMAALTAGPLNAAIDSIDDAWVGSFAHRNTIAPKAPLSHEPLRQPLVSADMRISESDGIWPIKNGPGDMHATSAAWLRNWVVVCASLVLLGALARRLWMKFISEGMDAGERSII